MKGKFFTTAILASLLLGSNAFASLARQAVFQNQPAFGTTAGDVTVNAVNGSLWYDDDYNVFYNPAYINDNKNYVSINKGMEGGFFKGEFENFAYGVYFNRGGGNTAATVNANTLTATPGYNPRAGIIGATATAINTQRPIDIFFGGDTGVKWGFHAAWAYNRNQTVANSTTGQNGSAELSNRYWHFDFGVQVMGFEPFLGATLFSKYQNDVTAQTGGGQTLVGNLDEFNAGFRYKYEGWTPYFVYKKWKESGTPAGGATQLSTRFHVFGLGVGHDTKVADGVHILKNIGVWQSSVEDDTAATAGTNIGGQTNPDFNKDFKETAVPINVALEAEATSWLTLRAGATYDFIRNRKFASSNKAANANPSALTDKNQSQAGATTFRIGSTFKFGKLHVDSAFGNGAGAAAAAGLDNQSFGFDGQTFALVSASYHW